MAIALTAVWSNGQFFDADGNPLSGGHIYTYENGSLTNKATTYTATGVPRTNPIVLDSSGFQTGGIYLDTSMVYTFVLTTPNGTVLNTVTNIEA